MTRLLVVTVLAIIIGVYHIRVTDRDNQITTLRNQLKTMHNDAYNDCQYMLQSERAISYFNGCYHAIEEGCGGISKCMHFYYYACTPN